MDHKIILSSFVCKFIFCVNADSSFAAAASISFINSLGQCGAIPKLYKQYYVILRCCSRSRAVMNQYKFADNKNTNKTATTLVTVVPQAGEFFRMNIFCIFK